MTSVRPRASLLVSTVGALMAAGLAIASTSTVHAQTAPAPVQPGDVAWAFANEDPFLDPRVATALGTLMAPFIEAGQPAGARIVRVQQRGPGVFEPGVVQPGVERLLLAAAGFGNSPPFVEVGQCKIWAAPPSGTTSAFGPAQAAPLISIALRKALDSLAVRSEPCELTTVASEAQILVVQGGNPPMLVTAQPPRFLSDKPPAAGAPAGAPASTSRGAPLPGAPRPATTGNAALDTPEASGTANAIAVLATGALLLVARALTARGGAQ